MLSELVQIGLVHLSNEEEDPDPERLIVIDSPSMTSVKVVDPGQILLGKEHDQTRRTLELKKLVDFSDEAFTQLYRIAPVDTWAIFADSQAEPVAQRLLEQFGYQILKIEGTLNSQTKAPKIFTV